jgi:hypothetical protein
VIMVRRAGRVGCGSLSAAVVEGVVGLVWVLGGFGGGDCCWFGKAAWEKVKCQRDVGTKGGEVVDSEPPGGAESESGGALSPSGGEGMFVVGVKAAKVTWGMK